MPFKSILLAAFLVMPMHGAALAQVAPGTPGGAERVACPTPLPWDGETEGETYSCAVVTVPENHARPGQRSLELLAMTLHSSTLSPRSDPLVYLSGGPGGSAVHEITSNSVLYKNMQAIRQRRDVVFYDQRGTGHSHLLACGPFYAGIGVVGETREEVSIDQMDELVEKGGMALISAACAAGYTGEGVDLGQFNSVASAHDINAVAGALGYDDGYNHYGTSYGTRLALVALRETPDAVRAAVLDGTISPAVPGNAQTNSKLRHQYDTIFRLCAEDAFCGTEYPDLRNRFITVLKSLAEEPLMLDPPLVPNDFFRNGFGVLSQIDPSFFADMARLNNGAIRGGGAAFLPVIVEALERRDTEAMRNVMGRGTPPAAPEVTPTAGEVDAIIADDDFIKASIGLILHHADQAVAAEDDRLSGTWLSLVVADLRRRLESGETQAEVIRDAVELAMVPLKGTDPAALVAYADEFLGDEAAAAANAVVAGMDRQTVRETMWAIGDIAEVMMGIPERSRGIGVSYGALNVVNCAEDISLTPEQVAEDYLATSPYPGVQIQTLKDYRLLRAGCSFFPSPFEGTNFMSPVESDIPVLIYAQGIDTQTPLPNGALVQETLPNSFLLEWLSEGHVIAARSLDGCAGDIAASFLDAPATRPDMSCAEAEAYTIPFRASIETLRDMHKDAAPGPSSTE